MEHNLNSRGRGAAGGLTSLSTDIAFQQEGTPPPPRRAALVAALRRNVPRGAPAIACALIAAQTCAAIAALLTPPPHLPPSQSSSRSPVYLAFPPGVTRQGSRSPAKRTIMIHLLRLAAVAAA
jgi:hypothetical protein